MLLSSKITGNEIPSEAMRGRILYQNVSWVVGKALKACPVNTPWGPSPPQAEAFTNIAIIAEKHSACQAQSPDVAHNMFQLSVVKVSGCFSNMDKKAALPFPVIFSTTGCSLFADSKNLPSLCLSRNKMASE